MPDGQLDGGAGGGGLRGRGDRPPPHATAGAQCRAGAAERPAAGRDSSARGSARKGGPADDDRDGADGRRQDRPRPERARDDRRSGVRRPGLRHGWRPVRHLVWSAAKADRAGSPTGGLVTARLTETAWLSYVLERSFFN